MKEFFFLVFILATFVFGIKVGNDGTKLARQQGYTVGYSDGHADGASERDVAYASIAKNTEMCRYAEAFVTSPMCKR